MSDEAGTTGLDVVGLLGLSNSLMKRAIVKIKTITHMIIAIQVRLLACAKVAFVPFSLITSTLASSPAIEYLLRSCKDDWQGLEHLKFKIYLYNTQILTSHKNIANTFFF